MQRIIDEINNCLSTDPSNNLEEIARVLVKSSASDICFFVEMKNGTFTPVASWGAGEFTPYPRAFEEAANLRKVCIYPGDTPIADSVICIPITVNHNFRVYNDERRIKNTEYSTITDFLYLQRASDNQGFSEEFIKNCEEIMNLLANCMNFYKTVRNASLDELTGALNRKFLDTAFEDWVFESTSKKGVFSLIMLDIDFFKGVNDVFGHLVGDEVLRKVAGILRRCISKGDILGRYGGEEFAVLLRGTDTAGAAERAEFIRKEIQNAKILEEKRDVTVSLGLASFPVHANCVKTLVEKADKALYMSKRTGRNKTQIWNEDFNDFEMEKGNKQQGFFTGDSVKDANRILSLHKLAETVRMTAEVSEKAVLALQEALVISGANNITFFNVADGEIAEMCSAAMPGYGPLLYNPSILKQVAAEQKPLHMIDWDNEHINTTAEFTDWQSIAVAPAVRKNELRGVLYAGVSIKQSVFKDDDLSYLSNAATIMAALSD